MFWLELCDILWIKESKDNKIRLLQLQLYLDAAIYKVMQWHHLYCAYIDHNWYHSGSIWNAHSQQKLEDIMTSKSIQKYWYPKSILHYIVIITFFP